MKFIETMIACFALYVIAVTAFPVLAVSESPPKICPAVARSVESADVYIVENSTVSAKEAERKERPDNLTINNKETSGSFRPHQPDSGYG